MCTREIHLTDDEEIVHIDQPRIQINYLNKEVVSYPLYPHGVDFDNNRFCQLLGMKSTAAYLSRESGEASRYAISMYLNNDIAYRIKTSGWIEQFWCVKSKLAHLNMQDQTLFRRQL